MNHLSKILIATAIASFTAHVNAATLVASYDFNNSLAANEAGKPSLVAIDPLGQNSFETAVVNGFNDTVYHWVGNGADASQQAGFSLDTTGLVNYKSYSVALTFEFSSQALTGGGWRRIIDTQNRQSDSGFYVGPSNKLEVIQIPTVNPGSTTFTTPGFHNVVLSVIPNGAQQTVSAYLDGQLEVTSTTDTFNLNNSDNPNHLLYFFVDNLFSNAQLEYANGRIASLKLYDGAFNPLAVPEPEISAMMLAGLGLVGFAGRRRKAV